MNQTRKNPTRIALLVAAIMSLGTAGIAAAQPGPGNQKISAKRPGKIHKGKRGAWKAKYDLDKDGVISPAEKTAMLRARFANLDLDKNGVLTAPELQRARAARMQGKQNKVGKNGKAYKNGKAHKRGKRGKAMTPAQKQARFARHFARLDANNDGRVTFAEFSTARRGMKGKKMRKQGKQSRKPAATPARATMIKARPIVARPAAFQASFRANYRFKL